MKKVKLKKSTVFLHFLGSLLFVIVGIFLLYDGIYSDRLLVRRIAGIIVGPISIIFFGRLFVVLAIVLFKNTILSYNEQKIVVNKREIQRTDIKKIERTTKKVPTWIPTLNVSGFIIHTKNGEKVYIPTYYVLKGKEEKRVNDLLKQYVSNYKMEI